jgi:hypothetical protein
VRRRWGSASLAAIGRCASSSPYLVPTRISRAATKAATSRRRERALCQFPGLRSAENWPTERFEKPINGEALRPDSEAPAERTPRYSPALRRPFRPADQVLGRRNALLGPPSIVLAGFLRVSYQAKLMAGAASEVCQFKELPAQCQVEVAPATEVSPSRSWR